MKYVVIVEGEIEIEEDSLDAFKARRQAEKKFKVLQSLAKYLGFDLRLGEAESY